MAPRDIAEVAVAHLLSTGWSGRTVQVSMGPWTSPGTRPRHRDHGYESSGARQRVDDAQLRDMLTTAGMSSGRAEAVLAMSTGVREPGGGQFETLWSGRYLHDLTAG